jgi:hypothetical protein
MSKYEIKKAFDLKPGDIVMENEKFEDPITGNIVKKTFRHKVLKNHGVVGRHHFDACSVVKIEFEDGDQTLDVTSRYDERFTVEVEK